NSAEIRAKKRDELGLVDENWMLLSVGSDYKRKGVDRTLRVIGDMPKEMRNNVRFWVIGQDNPAPFEKLAKQLRISANVHFLQGSDDIPAFLQAADMFLHPAYSENTGTVLLEALVAGAPIFVTEVCGYAHYIRDAQCGVVLSEPYNSSGYLTQLVDALYDKGLRAQWRENALRFAAEADLYSMPERATEIIESVVLAG
ncbi:MAG TPA: glycosyltransferase, partial [Pseudomonadales bacterium]|nr:glycosyltransferase [Pseudomonadales bacterium]